MAQNWNQASWWQTGGVQRFGWNSEWSWRQGWARSDWQVWSQGGWQSPQRQQSAQPALQEAVPKTTAPLTSSRGNTSKAASVQLTSKAASALKGKGKGDGTPAEAPSGATGQLVQPIQWVPVSETIPERPTAERGWDMKFLYWTRPWKPNG